MPDDPGFKRRLIVVALLHLILIGFFFVAGQWPAKVPQKDTIAWIDGSIGGGDEPSEADVRPASNPAPFETAPPELIKPEPEIPPPTPPPVEPPPPVEAPAPSELVTSTPVPATPTPKPETPKPATPKPATPKPATPKPTPKATPRATPKPSPTATPKPKASPKPTAEDGDATPKPKATPGEKAKGTPSAAKSNAAGDAAKLAFAKTKGGNGPGSGNGKGTAKSGDGDGMTKYGWYFAMLKDRFTSRWAQPTSIDRNGSEVIAILKVRISRDGVISNREIVQSSGFPQMDESVLRAAEKVNEIDPLPDGLGDGTFYDVNLQFKLDQAQ